MDPENNNFKKLYVDILNGIEGDVLSQLKKYPTNSLLKILDAIIQKDEREKLFTNSLEDEKKIIEIVLSRIIPVIKKEQNVDLAMKILGMNLDKINLKRFKQLCAFVFYQKTITCGNLAELWLYVQAYPASNMLGTRIYEDIWQRILDITEKDELVYILKFTKPDDNHQLTLWLKIEDGFIEPNIWDAIMDEDYVFKISNDVFSLLKVKLEDISNVHIPNFQKAQIILNCFINSYEVDESDRSILVDAINEIMENPHSKEDQMLCFLAKNKLMLEDFKTEESLDDYLNHLN